MYIVALKLFLKEKRKVGEKFKRDQLKICSRRRRMHHNFTFFELFPEFCFLLLSFDLHFFCMQYVLHTGQNPHFIQKLTYPKSHTYFKKFTFSKSYFQQNYHFQNHILKQKLHFQNHIFHENLLSPFFAKIAFSKSHFSQKIAFSITTFSQKSHYFKY